MPAYDALMALVDRSVQSYLGGEPVIYRSTTGGPPGGSAGFQASAFQASAFQTSGSSSVVVSATVTGIFDAAFVLAKGDANAGVEAVAPAVFLQLADLPADPEDDDPTLTIRGVDYRVIERRTADFGSIVLALRRVG